jgi:acetyl esterase/lipase
MNARRVVSALQVLLAVVFLFGAFLVLVPAQTTLLWKLEILAREQGHWFAVGALLVAAIGLFPGRRTSTQRAAALVTGLAAVVLALPAFRAAAMASSVRSAVAVFGDTTPMSRDGAPSLTTPMSLVALFTQPAMSEAPPTRHPYLAANGDTLALDLYAPAGVTTPPPVIVVIHGGSWHGGTRADLAELGRYLAARGYAVASISYRFWPRHTYPAAREDVQRALAMLRDSAESLKLDATRMVLLGRSAGGHLALLAAYADTSSSIRGVVALYPVADMRWGYDHPTNPRVLNSTATLEGFLGGSPSAVPGRYEEASPTTHIGPGSPSTVLIHGGGDELVFPEHTRRVAERLQTAGVKHMVLAMPWATHGCDYFINGPCGQLTTYVVERFVAAVTRP